MPVTPGDRELLIRTVMGEAGDHPEESQIAIAHAIVNRMASGKYGKSVDEVVRSPGAFAPWNDPATVADVLRVHPRSSPYQRVASVVDDVLSGKTPDPTNGATHFLNQSQFDDRFAGGPDVDTFQDRFAGTPDVDPFERAAARTRQAARPAGGRVEGGFTRALETAIPNLLKKTGDYIAFPREYMKPIPEVPGFWSEEDERRSQRRARREDLDWSLPLATGMVFDPLPALWGALKGQSIGSAASLGSGIRPGDEPAGPELTQGIRAYHGSPHDFDRFDISKIGTGEGAQAYGRGLYFAENPIVAAQYRHMLSGNTGAPFEGFAQEWIKKANGDKQLAIKMFENHAHEKNLSERARINMSDAIEMAPGKTYEVNIRSRPEEFLDWDAPISAQSLPSDLLKRAKSAHDIARKFGWIPSGSFGETRGSELYHNLLNALPRKGAASKLADQLKSEGVQGVRYLDEGSRLDSMMMAPQGGKTRNYAVFNDAIIDILRKYGLAGLAGMPALSAALPDGGRDNTLNSR